LLPNIIGALVYGGAQYTVNHGDRAFLHIPHLLFEILAKTPVLRPSEQKTDSPERLIAWPGRRRGQRKRIRGFLNEL